MDWRLLESRSSTTWQQHQVLQPYKEKLQYSNSKLKSWHQGEAKLCCVLHGFQGLAIRCMLGVGLSVPPTHMLLPLTLSAFSPTDEKNQRFSTLKISLRGLQTVSGEVQSIVKSCYNQSIQRRLCSISYLCEVLEFIKEFIKTSDFQCPLL